MELLAGPPRYRWTFVSVGLIDPSSKIPFLQTPDLENPWVNPWVADVCHQVDIAPQLRPEHLFD